MARKNIFGLILEIKNVLSNSLSGQSNVADDLNAIKESAKRKKFSKINQTVTAVSAEGKLIAAANEDRETMLIQNDSDVRVYLNFDGANLSVGKGIRLNANGGSFELNYADGGIYVGDIYAIHDAEGTKNIIVTEAVE